ncbi:MAG: right-handed parallel beta-helix repeat-containing protein, partial [Patescibacteria group bacterium]|nr:right-handed parallel beta-helix repeat-containing protein [Patescibacteria group bacterium]
TFWAAPGAYYFTVTGQGAASSSYQLTLPFGISGTYNAVAKSIEQVRYADQYGASPSNSAAVNTTALQAWLNSGGTRLYLPDGVYTTNELTLPSNVEIFGPGTLKQAVAGFEVFYCAGCSNVWIHGITLQGVGGNGVSPAPTNDDCGVKVANPSTSAAVANIRIDHVTFTGWLLYGAWLQNAKDIWFDHNYFYSSGPLLRLEGVNDAHVTDNIARDTSIDPSVFKSAISLPGTTGGYATDQHVIIAHNTVANYSNTQAVLNHSCTDCTVADNHFIGVNQGVGAAPAATTDTVVRLQVARNTYESTSTAGGSIGNQCIFVAGNATTSADHPVISGNTCYNANLVDQNTGEGAIGLSYTDGAIVEGNSLNHSYVSGIYLNNVNTNLHIGSNLIANGQVVGGLNEGVYLPSGQGAGTTGAIRHNTFTAYLDGLRFDTSATGLVIGENTFTGVTGSRIVSPSNVTVATTSYGTVNAQLQSDAYPSVVMDGPNRDLCIGAGTIACDITLSRGAGGTASFNARVDTPSLNINATGPLFTTAQTGTGSLVMSTSPSIASPTLTGTTSAATINATTLQQGGATVALA